MHTATEPLRHEHRQFSKPIETIQETVDAAGEVSMPELRDRIDATYAFLVEQFIPHASAKEKAGDPLVERAMDAPHATVTMMRDHLEVARLAQKLLALRERLVYAYFGQGELRALRDTVYDLHTIIELHLSKEEEEIYLPLLDEGTALEVVGAGS